MVRRHDEQIRIAQHQQQARERFVEAFQVGRVSRHVVAVPINRIEVDQVDEDEAIARIAQRLREDLHAFRVAGRVRRARDAAAREEIVDFPD